MIVEVCRVLFYLDLTWPIFEICVAHISPNIATSYDFRCMEVAVAVSSKVCATAFV